MHFAWLLAPFVVATVSAQTITVAPNYVFHKINGYTLNYDINNVYPIVSTASTTVEQCVTMCYNQYQVTPGSSPVNGRNKPVFNPLVGMQKRATNTITDVVAASLAGSSFTTYYCACVVQYNSIVKSPGSSYYSLFCNPATDVIIDGVCGTCAAGSVPNSDMSACIDLQSNNQNCGSIGNACPNNTPICSSGTCVACSAGTGYSAATRTCVSLNTISNCGAVNKTCVATGGTASCTNGQCGGSCASGYGYSTVVGDCVPLNTTSNCGTVGTTCSTTASNASPVCSGGQCGFACNSGYTLIKGTCQPIITFSGVPASVSAGSVITFTVSPSNLPYYLSAEITRTDQGYISSIGSTNGGTFSGTVPLAVPLGAYYVNFLRPDDSEIHTSTFEVTIASQYTSDPNNCGSPNHKCTVDFGGAPACQDGYCTIKCYDGFTPSTAIYCNPPYAITNAPSSAPAGSNFTVTYTLQNTSDPVSLYLKDAASTTKRDLFQKRVYSQLLGTGTNGSIEAFLPADIPTGSYVLSLGRSGQYQDLQSLEITENPSYVDDVDNCGFAGNKCTATGGPPSCVNSQCTVTCTIPNFVPDPQAPTNCIPPIAITSSMRTGRVGGAYELAYTAVSTTTAITLDLVGEGTSTYNAPLSNGLSGGTISGNLPSNLLPDSYRFRLSQGGFSTLSDPIVIAAAASQANGRQRRRGFRQAKFKSPKCALQHEAVCYSGTGDFECVDLQTDLFQCGKCAADGGEDCSAIDNAAAVLCHHGNCLVRSCKLGYRLKANQCWPSSTGY